MYRAGQTVNHPKFGVGTVLQTEGVGDEEKIQVNFREHGIKWLMLKYAKLETWSEPPKKPCPPRLTIVKNDNSVKNEIETQIVEQQTNNVTNNTHIEKQVNNYGKKPKPETVKRLSPEEGGLTDEQRIFIDSVTEKIVMLEEIARINTSWGKIRKTLCRKAKSTHLVTIKASNLYLVEGYFKETIGRLNKHPRVKELRNDKLEYAHQRFKELGVSKAKRYDTIRYDYQYLKYGHESTAYFEVWQLADYCEYLKQPNPTFEIEDDLQSAEPANIPKPSKARPLNNVVNFPTKQAKPLSKQEQRAKVLEKLLSELKAKNPEMIFSPLPFYSDDLLKMLQDKSPLFDEISMITFETFVRNSKLCSFQKGRKPKS